MENNVLYHYNLLKNTPCCSRMFLTVILSFEKEKFMDDDISLF